MSNWTQAPFPIAPWDALGLPPRTLEERCARHIHCGYRDDDPNRCPICHAAPVKCRGEHGQAPADGSWRRGAVAGLSNAGLRVGQHVHPQEACAARLSWPTAPATTSELISLTHRNHNEVIPA